MNTDSDVRRFRLDRPERPRAGRRSRWRARWFAG